MRSCLTTACMILVATLAARSASAQWSIDLATSGDQEFQVSPGTEAGVTIINKAPKNTYHVVAALRPIEVAPLGPVVVPLLEGGGDCPDLVKVAQELEKDTSETSTREHVAQLENALPTARCNPQQRTYILATIAGTIQKIPRRYLIHAGEELVVTVARIKADGSVEKTWKLTLTTGAAGSWRTLYGFAIVRDRDDQPYLTPGAKDGEFVVNRGAFDDDAEDKPVKLAPSIFFTWMSHSAELGPLSVSPTLGVGATSQLPGLFGGLALTYRQNLALVVGVPVVPERHVKPQYVKDPNVKSALTTDDLTQTKYHLRKWFIGGVFRFSSNPFEAKKPAEEKPEEKSAAPAKGEPDKKEQ